MHQDPLTWEMHDYPGSLPWIDRRWIPYKPPVQPALILSPALPSLERSRVEDQAVGGPPLMPFWQVLGDRQSLRGDEQQAVAVFPLLHLVAGAQPPPAMLLK